MVRFALVVLGIAVAAAAVAALADLAGLPVPAGAIGGAVGGVVGALMLAAPGPRRCPRCAAGLPRYRRPASLQQALWGGWTCTSCGCVIDRQGHAVAGGLQGG